ncbi:MAG: hypothetical protein ACI8RZ_006307 [Myxococcota bacterium]|jgi:hypothetical protein
MHKALAIIGLAAMTTSGCVVYSDGGGGGGYVEPVPNATPYINWANAGCYYDGSFNDDIWYFEADVDDANGVNDVTAVYADVYDVRTGQWVETFELFPTNDPYIWFSDWLGQSTYLDCNYGGYEVEIVAYDIFDAYDVLSLAPATYNYY